MAKQVGPAHGIAGNDGAPRGRCIVWHPCARTPSWPGAEGPYMKRPEIRLQSVPSLARSRHASRCAFSTEDAMAR